MLTHSEAINHTHGGAAVDASFKGIQFRERTALPTGTYFSVSKGFFSTQRKRIYDFTEFNLEDVFCFILYFSRQPSSNTFP